MASRGCSLSALLELLLRFVDAVVLEELAPAIEVEEEVLGGVGEADARCRWSDGPRLCRRATLHGAASLSPSCAQKPLSCYEVAREPHRAKSRERRAKPTITVELDLDGSGKADVQTPLPFLSHMVEQIARHGLIDLTVRAEGDVEIDGHHTTEDLGIVLGQAVLEALGDKAGIVRYGWATLPMDEALVTAALDLSGRPFFVWKVPLPKAKLGTLGRRARADLLRGVRPRRAVQPARPPARGREPPPHRRDLVQGVRQGALRRRRASTRASPWCPPPKARSRLPPWRSLPSSTTASAICGRCRRRSSARPPTPGSPGTR